METYQIRCLNEDYYILADKWAVGEDGLKFFQGEKAVAWFTTWDCWKILTDEEEPEYFRFPDRRY